MPLIPQSCANFCCKIEKVQKGFSRWSWRISRPIIARVAVDNRRGPASVLAIPFAFKSLFSSGNVIIIIVQKKAWSQELG